MGIQPVTPRGFSPRQSIGAVELKSPLTAANQVVATIKSLINSGALIMTVDFALGRFKNALAEAGVSRKIIDTLIKLNLDHHDGINPGKTATEVALAKIERHPRLFYGNYVVLSDQVIDADNVCGTFALLNPGMAKQYKAILAGAARYGDYYDKVNDAAMKLVLTIDAMRFGKNKFGQPFFKLTAEQQGELFNEILEAMPKMLANIEQFKDLYEGELAKLKSEEERAIKENLIVPVSDHVAVVDDPKLPRSTMYQLSDRAVVISRTDLGDGKSIYNPVGLNPRVADYNLLGLWQKLRNLENSERAKKGIPALDDNQNWGGREVAGGSNRSETIGSILTLEQVAQAIEEFIQPLRT